MKNKIIGFFDKENLILFFIFLSFLFSIFLLSFDTSIVGDEKKDLILEVKKQQNLRLEKILNSQKEKLISLKKKGCVSVIIDSDVCDFKKKDCFKFNTSIKNIVCKYWEVAHVKKPEILKSLYYTTYSANSSKKIDQLIDVVKKTEINSVTIDIKEVDGRIAFDMSEFNFGSIKPISNKIIKNPKKLIEKLHQNGIYVVGRMVVFKDKILSEKRPDLAIKTLNRKKVWTDYRGKKYLDPNNKEVWDYQINLARAIYMTGFDEINFDYIRFPSDGNMNNMYHPFSEKEITKNKRWGRSMIMDKFFNYLTSSLRKEFPKIELSGDLFGYTALENSDLKIGQILEDAVLYFDRISPMTYPSHYNQNFLGLNTADSHPYEVIKYTMKKINFKLERINKEIDLAKKENRKILIRENFEASLDINKIKKIKKEKVAIWLQGFSCTWCKNHISYNKSQIQSQIRAAKEEGYDNWYVWNAASRYGNWFEKK